jgi:aryl-alcohol dehydrogenase-like predicted oxidoreductase
LSGILTGKYNNGIPEGARFDTNPTMIGIYNRYFTDKKDQTIESLRKFGELAKELDCNMAQLALAWVIANPDVSTAITGASSPSQLQDSVKSIDLITKLTPEIQVRIEDIFQTSPFGKRNMKTMQKETSRRRAILKY